MRRLHFTSCFVGSIQTTWRRSSPAQARRQPDQGMVGRYFYTNWNRLALDLAQVYLIPRSAFLLHPEHKFELSEAILARWSTCQGECSEASSECWNPCHCEPRMFFSGAKQSKSDEAHVIASAAKQSGFGF